tara:strand:+ start:614 stop:826 length:213 start_codon:yes stop_codon:yes gene_type:complete
MAQLVADTCSKMYFSEFDTMHQKYPDKILLHDGTIVGTEMIKRQSAQTQRQAKVPFFQYINKFSHPSDFT